MAQENNAPKQNGFFQAGYRLGLGGEKDKFAAMQTALTTEESNAEKHHNAILKQSQDAALNLLDEIRETADDLQKHINNFLHQHLQYIKQLEVETGIWAALQPPDPQFYVDQRKRGLDIFKASEDALREAMLNLGKEVQQVQFSKRIEEMEQKLLPFLENELTTARNNLRDLRRGYSEGAGIRKQMDDLDGTSGSGGGGDSGGQ